MKCAVKGCDNDLPEKPREFNILTPDFKIRRVNVCDACHEDRKPGRSKKPLYIPLKEGA